MTLAAMAPSGPRRPGRPPAFLPGDFEVVLPAQWVCGVRTSQQPAKRLMLAILSDALELVIQNPAPPHSRRAHWQGRAAEWICSDDRGWLFSFVTVCETLGLDPRRIRVGVARLKEQREPAPTALHDLA